MLHYLQLLASVYGEGTYGEGLYSADTVATDPGTGLADTGTMIVALITLACLLIFVALIVRHFGRKGRAGK